MKALTFRCVLLIAAMASPQAAAAAGPNLPSNAAQPKQTGVSTEVDAGGFALVTLGTWRVPSATDRLKLPSARPDRFSAARTPRIGSGSFRRAMYLPHVQATERQHRLPPGLLDALIWTESRYNPVALSKAGAAGLGQLMPATAQALGITNRYDFRANLSGSAQYLRQMLDQFRSVELALGAYNAGPRAVIRSGRIPQNSETPAYVQAIIETWQRLQNTRIRQDQSD
jgi:soluble lytic murein transglycosylase-like protein